MTSLLSHRRRFLVTLIAIVTLTTGALAATGTASAANPLPGWIHVDGKYFTYWKPTKDWQAVETDRGLDITSPTGLYMVSYGWTTLAMPTTTAQVFQTIVNGHANDFTQWQAVKTTPVAQTPMGTRQIVEFTAMHKYPLQGWQPVHGVAVADALDTGMGGYGMDATVVYAPAKDWAKQSSTLDRIRTNITPMHG